MRSHLSNSRGVSQKTRNRARNFKLGGLGAPRRPRACPTSTVVKVLLAFVVTVLRAADWPMPGGNPQRNGWARSEHLINKANVRGLKLLYKYQTDNVSKGHNSLTAPIIS